MIQGHRRLANNRYASVPMTPRSLAAVLMACVFALGCATNTGTTLDKKRTQGALLGALAGAAAGAALDKKDARGALIGAAVGGLTGGLIGNYMDKQAQEIEDAIPDADVQRRGDGLQVMFAGDLLFDSGSSGLSAGAYNRMRTLAETLRGYPDTNVIVRGHTDSQGAESFNLKLSEDRADSVRRLLISEGVEAHRVTSIGLGEALPVSTNDTPEGRQQNRRVEIELRPTDALRERHDQAGGGSTY